jgi:hypothetical protein
MAKKKAKLTKRVLCDGSRKTPKSLPMARCLQIGDSERKKNKTKVQQNTTTNNLRTFPVLSNPERSPSEMDDWFFLFFIFQFH